MKKIFSIILVAIAAIGLVGCTKGNDSKKITNLITESSYEKVINTNTSINFEMESESLKTPTTDEEGNPTLGMELTDFKLVLKSGGYLKTYSDSRFMLDVLINFNDMNMVSPMGSQTIYKEGNIHFRLMLTNSNIYTLFNGTVKDNQGVGSHDFSDIISMIIMFGGSMIPAEIMPFINALLPIFDNYKEYKENAYNQMIYSVIVANGLKIQDEIKKLLTVEDISNSKFDINTKKQILTIKSTTDEVIDSVSKLDITVDYKGNMFNSLKGITNLEFSSGMKLDLKFDVKTNLKEQVDLGDLSGYEKVDKLVIELIIEDIINIINPQ